MATKKKTAAPQKEPQSKKEPLYWRSPVYLGPKYGTVKGEAEAEHIAHFKAATAGVPNFDLGKWLKPYPAKVKGKTIIA